MTDPSSGADPKDRQSCPVCRKTAQDAFRPFCSGRCRDVDLGRWLGERYVISGNARREDEAPPSED